MTSLVASNVTISILVKPLFESNQNFLPTSSASSATLLARRHIHTRICCPYHTCHMSTPYPQSLANFSSLCFYWPLNVCFGYWVVMDLMWKQRSKELHFFRFTEDVEERAFMKWAPQLCGHVKRGSFPPGHKGPHGKALFNWPSECNYPFTTSLWKLTLTDTHC